MNSNHGNYSPELLATLRAMQESMRNLELVVSQQSQQQQQQPPAISQSQPAVFNLANGMQDFSSPPAQQQPQQQQQQPQPQEQAIPTFPKSILKKSVHLVNTLPTIQESAEEAEEEEEEGEEGVAEEEDEEEEQNNEPEPVTPAPKKRGSRGSKKQVAEATKKTTRKKKEKAPSKAVLAHKPKYTKEDLVDPTKFKVLQNGALAGTVYIKDAEGKRTGKTRHLIFAGAKSLESRAPLVTNVESEQEKSETTSKPVAPKKSRGRPKKSAPIPIPGASAAAAPAVNTSSEVAPKKKRLSSNSSKTRQLPPNSVPQLFPTNIDCAELRGLAAMHRVQ